MAVISKEKSKAQLRRLVDRAYKRGDLSARRARELRALVDSGKLRSLNPIDRDGDGIIFEGTRWARRVAPGASVTPKQEHRLREAAANPGQGAKAAVRREVVGGIELTPEHKKVLAVIVRMTKGDPELAEALANFRSPHYKWGDAFQAAGLEDLTSAQRLAVMQHIVKRGDRPRKKTLRGGDSWASGRADTDVGATVPDYYSNQVEELRALLAEQRKKDRRNKVRGNKSGGQGVVIGQKWDPEQQKTVDVVVTQEQADIFMRNPESAPNPLHLPSTLEEYEATGSTGKVRGIKPQGRDEGETFVFPISVIQGAARDLGIKVLPAKKRGQQKKGRALDVDRGHRAPTEDKALGRAERKPMPGGMTNPFARLAGLEDDPAMREALIRAAERWDRESRRQKVRMASTTNPHLAALRDRKNLTPLERRQTITRALLWELDHEQVIKSIVGLPFKAVGDDLKTIAGGFTTNLRMRRAQQIAAQKWAESAHPRGPGGKFRGKPGQIGSVPVKTPMRRAMPSAPAAAQKPAPKPVPQVAKKPTLADAQANPKNPWVKKLKSKQLSDDEREQMKTRAILWEMDHRDTPATPKVTDAPEPKPEAPAKPTGKNAGMYGSSPDVIKEGLKSGRLKKTAEMTNGDHVSIVWFMEDTETGEKFMGKKSAVVGSMTEGYDFAYDTFSEVAQSSLMRDMGYITPESSLGSKQGHGLDKNNVVIVSHLDGVMEEHGLTPRKGRDGKYLPVPPGAIEDLDVTELASLHVMDYLMGQNDRHLKNGALARGQDGKQHVVFFDHGNAFDSHISFIDEDLGEDEVRRIDINQWYDQGIVGVGDDEKNDAVLSFKETLIDSGATEEEVLAGIDDAIERLSKMAGKGTTEDQVEHLYQYLISMKGLNGAKLSADQDAHLRGAAETLAYRLAWLKRHREEAAKAILKEHRS